MARKKGLMGFAQARAGDVNPLWGALASGATGTGTAIGVRAMTGMDKHAELIGLGVGVATGGALMLSKKTRAAGFVGIVTALLTNGLRAAEAMMGCKQQVKDLKGAEVTYLAKNGTPCKTQLEAAKAAAKAGGFGAVEVQRRQLAAATAQAVPSLGAVEVQRRQLAGGGAGGLGIVSPEVLRSLSGSPVKFQGNAQATIVGSRGIGAAYGATSIGGGR